MDFWEANWQDNHLGVSERMMCHQFKEVLLKSKNMQNCLRESMKLHHPQHSMRLASFETYIAYTCYPKPTQLRSGFSRFSPLERGLWIYGFVKAVQVEQESWQ